MVNDLLREMKPPLESFPAIGDDQDPDLIGVDANFEAIDRHEREKEKTAGLEQNRFLRKEYAEKAFLFAWIGLGFWAFIIFFYALIFICSGERILSDAVLIAITSATTVNLFAAFIGVIRGLFPVKKYDKPNP